MAASVVASAFNVGAYLGRIGIVASASSSADLSFLTTITNAHSRAIAFENFDVVLRRPVLMAAHAIEAKLVGNARGDLGDTPAPRRGGYCFEQNTLLMCALGALGYFVEPILCRVRWGKAVGEETPFTHMALRVRTSDGRVYLADVGFAGLNSVAPLELTGTAQKLPEGLFRSFQTACGGWTKLQVYMKGDWVDLYMWRSNEAATSADLAVANFWSHAAPTARFTGCFFASRVVGEDRHHILNDTYTVRGIRNKGTNRGTVREEEEEEEATTLTHTRITGEGHLVQLLSGVFQLDPPMGLAQEWSKTYAKIA